MADHETPEQDARRGLQFVVPLVRGRWRWLPAVAMAAVIAWFSHRPDWPDAAVGYPDWLLHGLAFGGLALAVTWGLTRGFRGARVPPGAALAAILATSLYGVVDELHQSFIPGRDAAFADWVADTIGASVALVVLGLSFAALRALWENRAHSAPPAPSCPDRE